MARVTSRSEISFNHNNWVGGLKIEHFAYVFSLKAIPGSWAVDARALTMDRQEITTPYLPDGTDIAVFEKRSRAYGDKSNIGRAGGNLKGAAWHYARISRSEITAARL